MYGGAQDDRWLERRRRRRRGTRVGWRARGGRWCATTPSARGPTVIPISPWPRCNRDHSRGSGRMHTPVQALRLLYLALLAAQASALGAQSASCDHALISQCDGARRQGLFACGSCTGNHLQTLKEAGCNSTYIEYFCSNQSCVLDFCTNARSEGAFQCAKCLGQHGNQLGQCSLEQQMEYCKFKPPLDGPPIPNQSSIFPWFGCHSVQAVSLSINGVKGNDATAPLSEPVNMVIEWTDRISGTCGCPTCYFQHLGVVYLWQDDDQMHDALAQNCFQTYQGENLPVGGTTQMQFTPTVPGIYYFTTNIDMQMSCSGATGKKSTNFSRWTSSGAIARVTVHG